MDPFLTKVDMKICAILYFAWHLKLRNPKGESQNFLES